MSDFTSDFWGLYIALITIVSIIACGVLLFTFSSTSAGAPGETTGHTWDEDLIEGTGAGRRGGRLERRDDRARHGCQGQMSETARILGRERQHEMQARR